MNTLPLETSSCTEAPTKNYSLHEPFSWLKTTINDSASKRDAEALDAFRGIATCLELVEMSNLDRELADPEDANDLPLLSKCDTGHLMRLAILVANEWALKAERRISERNSREPSLSGARK